MLTDPAVGDVGDVDSTAVTIRTRRGRLAQINTSDAPHTATTSASKCSARKDILQAGNHRPTEVVAHTAASVSQDKPEHFFLERYRAAYALEMAHFFDALAHGKPVRTTSQDGVKALELADAATTSWHEKRIVALWKKFPSPRPTGAGQRHRLQSKSAGAAPSMLGETRTRPRKRGEGIGLPRFARCSPFPPCGRGMG